MREIDSETCYPLSPMQQGMMFHSLYAPESGVNIQQVIGTLHHELDAVAFRRAWEKVSQRHPVLRTSFSWEGLEEPMQTVHDKIEMPFEEQDWVGTSAPEIESRLENYLKADRKRGFALMKAPLMRVALFKENEKRHQFVWTFHHAVLDGRSFATVINEVFAVYEAAQRDEEPRFTGAGSFQNYVRWLKDQDFSKSEQFWRERLKGFTTPTPLVVDKSGKSAGVEYGEQCLQLSAEATSVLKAFAREHAIGLSTMLQGAWALLLGRYGGGEDVVFGVTQSGRRSSIEGAEGIAGIFINTLPMRAKILTEMTVLDWLRELREQQNELRAHVHTPLLEIQKWSEMPAGTQLFESIIVFDRATLNATLQAQGGGWRNRHFRVIDQTNFPLTLFGFAEQEMILKFEFDQKRFETPVIQRMLGHLKTLLEGLAKHPQKKLAELTMLTADEERQMLVEWNQTRTEYQRESCVHELFEAQAARTPEATAVVFQDEEWSYQDLDQQANELACHLQSLGVGPEVLVGICVERSVEMVVGLLGILKSGGAYVPLDPVYPQERLAHMMADSRMPVLLTQEHLLSRLPEYEGRVVCVDAMDWQAEDTRTIQKRARPENPAYVIYTSGSTGKPKGVVLMHRNVVNFFAGMDKILGTIPGTWLAVTSISFDISVLELFWTLTRGFKVVIQGVEEPPPAAAEAQDDLAGRKMDFSLFYFSGDENQTPDDKYRLLLEGAKFADQNGLAAVWTPERHFHEFGGLYPNPAVTGAAIAAVTQRIQIRAGSVVLPLHDPIRVAEEWAMVDNLSRGRVGLSFASGWHSNDFIFAPDNYAKRKELMYQQIETVIKLWRGGSIESRGGDGNMASIKVFPRPVRLEVPLWITASGSPDTFRAAGEMGANILTNLLGQKVEEVAEKIAIYRRAWREHGHGPGEGQVTLMLHTFVERDMETVREKVRRPFTEYLKTSVDLIKKASSAWSFAAFSKPGADAGDKVDFKNLSAEDMQALLDHAFERYFETSGLFGTPESCLRMVNQLKRIGVDEVACLIDFGVDTDSVLTSLQFLKELNQISNRGGRLEAKDKYALTEQMRRHQVTHFQCTPSLARMLVSDPKAVGALGSLREMLVGGEALPPSLAEQLTGMVGGLVHNMYGPTETAIWSTTQLITKSNAREVTIGRPLANTEIYIIDRNGQPAPVGLPGELLIGGEGVARGYLNRPDLTGERFVTNRFGGTSERLYRTGDLARYREDGTIEYLGRIDHQVKLRGHRIELGEIESALAKHPLVKESVVVAMDEKTGDKRLVAYVVPRSKSDAEAERNASDERIAQWQMIWDGTYSEPNKNSASTFNLAGWRSSYTGEPIPEDEMREWVENTVERILSLHPERTLEIGCGTGLLMFRVAPHCKAYSGVDFSEGALNYLQRELPRHELPQVTLMRKAADDLGEIPPESFDMVVINSVVQYFPSIDYLMRVMEGAVKAASPGGRILIGDVRSLPLLEAFHASVEMHQAPSGLTRAEFKERVQNRLGREEELAIDPSFFRALQAHLPQIKRAEILLKPGRFHNEITRFRYDVILHVGGESKVEKAIKWLDWSKRASTPLEIKQLLAEPEMEALGIARVPNARLHAEGRVVQWMSSQDGPETIGELRASLPACIKGAIDPENLMSLAREAGFVAEISWSDSELAGSYDVIFRRGDIMAAPRSGSVPETRRREWREYSNTPAQGRPEAKLLAQLRSHLKQELPEIMVPSSFVVLERMPLTPNGKIDRRSLPAPDSARRETDTEWLAPKTQVEQALAAIWCEVLGVDKVGTGDNFFELGGHSLLATQLISRLRESFRMEIPLRCLFDAPTVGKLAQAMVTFEARPGLLDRTAIVLNRLSTMSPGELDRALQQRRQEVMAT
jgi:natural product biosynthesis luciferase-like monooxygenase protein